MAFGDVDLGGGEVEMVCGSKIIDVPWSEFKKCMKIDPDFWVLITMIDTN
ncbi:MAG: hypothetical protein WBB82_01120 [Limnothrix sp.]